MKEKLEPLVTVFGGGLGNVERRAGMFPGVPETGDRARPPPALCDERQGELPGWCECWVLGLSYGPGWTGASVSGEKGLVLPDQLQH